jgi:hypothetical protein
MSVGDQQNCLVVQKNAQFSYNANGVFPADDVVVSLQDKMGMLKKRALAHQSFKIWKQDTMLARMDLIGTLSIGRGQLGEVSMLLGRIWVGGLIMTGMITWVLVLAVAHNGVWRRGMGNFYFTILRKDLYPHL